MVLDCDSIQLVNFFFLMVHIAKRDSLFGKLF